MAQTDQQLAITSSERLGHRQRALVPSDYKTLVLAQFPQIEEARCLPANEFHDDTEYTPQARYAITDLSYRLDYPLQDIFAAE